NFNQIVKNIRQLRKESSSITIALSVVLSRANLDELARIVQLATELSVNVINVTPLEHMPLLELKRSDLPIFEAQLDEGKRLADQAGITLSVAIGHQNFNDSNDTPRDKKDILRILASTNPAQEKNAQVEDIAHELQTTPFRYYPDAIVFVDQPILERTSVQSENDGATCTIRPEFDIDIEISRLDQQIASCLKTLREHAQPSFTLPYCLDPWKLNYIKSNGKNRLCCHTDHIVGNMGNAGFRNAINSEQYRRIRRAMTGSSPLLDACKKCRAQDRALGFESIIETCREFNLPLPPMLRL
ncbi:MAG: SPASM domain-containing protein, partial [bacterium]|nr:SPASM domain-containing protein [bacterium]